MRITAYDLGLRADILVAVIVYVVALTGTAVSAFYMLRI
jgi:hypothetical protein